MSECTVCVSSAQAICMELLASTSPAGCVLVCCLHMQFVTG